MAAISPVGHVAERRESEQPDVTCFKVYTLEPQRPVARMQGSGLKIPLDHLAVGQAMLVHNDLLKGRCSTALNVAMLDVTKRTGARFVSFKAGSIGDGRIVLRVE